MSSTSGAGDRVTGSVRSAHGHGVVRIEARFETRTDEVWSALTEHERLARWYGDVDGELRLGGEYRAHLHASGWEGTGRVTECEPPTRFVVVSRGSEAANERTTEVALSSAGDEGVLVVEQHGLPLDLVWAFGTGLQIHVEDLGAHLAGRDRCDSKTRFAELEPTYKELTADLAQ
jgi:uncharacterized protein YndB with AHSA1/START domain